MKQVWSKYKWGIIIGGLTLLLVIFILVYLNKKNKLEKIGTRLGGDNDSDNSDNSDNNDSGSQGGNISEATLNKYANGGNVYKGVPGARDFGMKLHPISKTYKMHYGIDFKNAGLGVPYMVIKPGIVTDAREAGGCGNMVIVKHDDGSCTKACHLDKILVEDNQRIDKPTIVGIVGNTGGSTGPHLHWEWLPKCTKQADGKQFIDDYFRFVKKK